LLRSTCIRDTTRKLQSDQRVGVAQAWQNGFGQAPQTNPDLIFSGIFVAGLFQKQSHITSYAFYVRCLRTVPHTSKQSDVLTASLSNSFKDY